MPDILHRVGIKSSSPDAIYNALTTREGLSDWWTKDTEGEGGLGDVTHFRFAGGYGFDIKTLALDPGKRVAWQVVEGPEDWVGTKVDWELRQNGDYTIVLFKHEGWREELCGKVGDDGMI
jgi:uncharacterized protein YndB with AHSA1/START domain